MYMLFFVLYVKLKFYTVCKFKYFDIVENQKNENYDWYQMRKINKTVLKEEEVLEGE